MYSKDMEKIYRTDEEFREALQKRLNINFSDKVWEGLKLLYGLAAIHIALTDADIDECVWIWNQTRGIYKRF